MQDIGHILMELTPTERWSAARRFDAGPASDSWFIIAAFAMLVVLAALLVWVSLRRRRTRRTHVQEAFAEQALHRGLTTRERQILLAIAVRSGLAHSSDIYAAADAFSRGAGDLLAEWVRTRTPQDHEQLEGEIGRLREKLGFQVSLDGAGRSVSTRASTQNIPLGRCVELTRRKDAEGVSIWTEVVANDEAGLTVEARQPVATHAGDLWRARHCSGLSAWEFDTVTISADGKRLTLSHTDRLHFVNRRRFPRVAVRTPALVARFPFVLARGEAERNDSGNADMESDTLTREVPQFVGGVVTELAGPGLRIETSLRVRPGERVLVLFRMYEGGPNAQEKRRTIAGVGQVKHCRSTDRIVAVAVELVGLMDGEIDELVYIADVVAQRDDRNGGQERDAEKTAVGAAAR